MKIEFEIPGEAVAKGRPRLGKFGTYTPAKTVNYENWVKICFTEKYRNFKQLEGRLRATFSIYMPIPKSTSKKDRQAISEGIISPTKKPDWDNFGKIISDALNELAYKDDAQIVDSHVIKYYAEQPKAVVEIEEF